MCVHVEESLGWTWVHRHSGMRFVRHACLCRGGGGLDLLWNLKFDTRQATVGIAQTRCIMAQGDQNWAAKLQRWGH